MAKETDNKGGAYTMQTDGAVGEVMIADDVIATIAGLAATGVEGVVSMQGNLTNEIVGRLGMKNLTKGVRIELEDKVVSAFLSLTVRYGYSIPKVSAQVQDSVKTAIESMVGLEVAEVNIHIVGVDTNTVR